MPRGVAIPELRQQLFAAAEQVVVRDGPSRLSGRAVTGEAGVATGLLYAHFVDLDDFLAAYAVDRSFVISAEAAALPERSGTGSVVGNLCAAVLATPLVTVLALTRLLVSRPELAGRVRAVLGDETTGLDAIESAAATYLAEEQRLGRLTGSAEPSGLALALVGVLHHLLLTAATEADVRAGIRRTITSLVRDYTAATA
ncbi:TetR family transcriptional regulator [Amycolatopsis cihanbeyliensis]|uniref:TetR family transcriptional regulator n=1 Tax=Amycolatopsis cihanbeyliensis TaxID=1128664 RepID=A0A542DFA6_AMYCI|nr:TetR family transcriptional regulator [Amycolatopsis cihanbeyliensis]TQJ01778.1 TetR family transcriptional regulator [Amycolatopsis cihanbeyliensis]